MDKLEQASALFSLVCEDSSDKIVVNNLKNAKIIVKELSDLINKAKDASNTMDSERLIKEAMGKCNLIMTNLMGAADYM